jgi:hypothetical protein
MAKFNMEITHTLAQDEAAKRIKRLLGDVKAQFADKIANLKEEWKEGTGTFSFTAMGFAVSGTLTVANGKVNLDGTIPFLAVPFKGMIETTIREKAVALLA